MAISTQGFAQSDFDRSVDPESGSLVFKGQVDLNDLKKEESFSWLSKGADSYIPDSAGLDYLKKNLPAYNVIVFMGTWCEDTHLMLPRLLKTLQLISYPMDKLKIYGVDRNKETKYVEHKLYRIDRVPTILVFKSHTEIGRITEVVQKSVENDLEEILKANSGEEE